MIEELIHQNEKGSFSQKASAEDTQSASQVHVAWTAEEAMTFAFMQQPEFEKRQYETRKTETHSFRSEEIPVVDFTQMYNQS